MITKVYSGSVIGIDAYRVDVEVDVASQGLPGFAIIGLPDTAIRESKDRIKFAIKNSGFKSDQNLDDLIDQPGQILLLKGPVRFFCLDLGEIKKV